MRQIGAVNPFVYIEAENIGWSYGVKTAKINEPGSMVRSINLAATKIHNGDWIGNGQVDFGEKGAKSISVNAARRAGGVIEVRLDTVNGPKVGEIAVPAGDGTVWQVLRAATENVAGVTVSLTGGTSGRAVRAFIWDDKYVPYTETGGC